ncbi:uncharacterized protein LOC114279030 [Camellia sinensis]|uniref:uncharacterized protein LOC114279030 n=1 Tax=Camellia sinensis TaxID=4442 RepID=UPI0010360E08|nr:uncharacterized protein LOC114279030 [Camellia sinensis]
MCHQTLMNQLMSLWSIFFLVKKMFFIKHTGFLGLSGKSADAIDFYTSEIERLSKEMLSILLQRWKNKASIWLSFKIEKLEMGQLLWLLYQSSDPANNNAWKDKGTG